MLKGIKLSRLLPWFDIKDFAHYTSGNLTFQIASIVAELTVLAFVSIENMGNWQLGLLIQSYVVLARLGIINAFNREYPYLSASEDVEKSTRILATTSLHVMISSFFQAIVFLFAFLYYRVLLENNPLSLVCLAMVFYTVFDGFLNFEEARLRSTKQFKRLGGIKFVGSIIVFLTLLLPFYFDFQGLLIRAVLVKGVLWIILFDKSSYSEFKTASWPIWRHLFNDGWKLWVISYLRSFNKSAPKLYLAIFASIGILGLYTPVNWILLSLTLFTTSIGSYLYPHLSSQFAIKGNRSLKKQSIAISGLSFMVLIPVVLLSYTFLPKVVSLLLPEYTSVIEPMRIALLASLFDVFLVSTTVWIAMKAWEDIFFFVIISLMIRMLSLVWTYTCFTDVLLGVSYSMLLTSFASVLLMIGIMKYPIRNRSLGKLFS